MTETKACKNCSQNFLVDQADFDFYKRIDVPAPTFCPDCRLERRFLFRNERNFYKRTCDLCKKGIISLYAENVSFPVYCVKCWWSDKWDPKAYGRDYDPSRPFMDQFKELFYSVPMLTMQNDDGVGSVNCEYTNDFAFSKNCYLVIAAWYLENTMYTYHANYSKDIGDSYHLIKSELCYEMVASADCFSCAYGTLCYGCSEVRFGYDLRGCTDCIMCVGLRNKSYCILNQQYTKEEYLKKKQEMRLGDRDRINRYQNQFAELVLKYPHKFAYNTQTVNSTGNLLMNCKNARDSFYFFNLEDCRYMVLGDGGKNSYDCTNTGNPDLCYESVTPDNSYGNIVTIHCWKCNKAEYSNNCHSSNNVFGCSGLKHSEYSILNKQYSKDEFVLLRSKIIEKMKASGEWGEFFPASMSPFAVNETAVQDWLPFAYQRAIEKGFVAKYQEKKEYQVAIQPDDIPLTIAEADDSILTKVIGCRHAGMCAEKCSTAFKITNQELQFYRRLDIPIPEFCHNCRYYQRLSRRNLPQLWHRQCMCDHQLYKNTTKHAHHEAGRCPNKFETSYAPDRPEIIYCEACYQAEVL